MTSAAPVHTGVTRRWNSLAADVSGESFSGPDRRPNQPHIPRSQSPERGPDSPVLGRPRGEEAAEGALEASRGLGSCGLRTKPSPYRQVQGEAVSAGAEAAASYPEDSAKIVNESGYAWRPISG